MQSCEPCIHAIALCTFDSSNLLYRIYTDRHHQAMVYSAAAYGGSFAWYSILYKIHYKP